MILLLEDTRQQEKKHKYKHDYFRSHGIHWNRTALYCGDYTLPANQSVCVDTKKDIAELIGDIQIKKMPKKEIHKAIYDICELQGVSFDLAEQIYHAICDDDENRFAEKDINNICFENSVPERAISSFQTLYVKRHGFFHRGLKRAQNSEIKLYILVDNLFNITCIDDLNWWENPRRSMKKWITMPDGERKKIPVSPGATNGDILAKSLHTMEQKYGCEFCFCRPEDAGKNILKLLEVSICEV